MNKLAEGKLQADTWKVYIDSQTQEDELLSSELRGDVRLLVQNGDYRSYYTSAYKIKGKEFSISFFFKQSRLAAISLSPASQNPSWENAEYHELEKSKRANDRWLQDKFGIKAPKKFSWGTIESTIDPRGGFSEIVLRYIQ